MMNYEVGRFASDGRLRRETREDWGAYAPSRADFCALAEIFKT